ncbi:MAG: hypothetical protein ABSC25_27775 [Roseiarcus sp.]
MSRSNRVAVVAGASCGVGAARVGGPLEDVRGCGDIVVHLT